jgi:hypothetical protein
MKVKATLDGFVGFGGQSVPISSGSEYDESDPLVQAHRHLFDPKPEPPKVVAAVRKVAKL